MNSYVNEHAFGQKTGFFCGHDEIVRGVFVVDDILEINSRVLMQSLEELLIVNPCHTADLGHILLFRCVSIDKVGGDGDGQHGTKDLALKARQSIAATVRGDQDIELIMGHRMMSLINKHGKIQLIKSNQIKFRVKKHE